MNVSLRSLAGLALLVLGVGIATQWWQQRHEARQGERLAALAAPGDIRMIASVTCAPCMAARQWLERNRVAFDECLVERDAQCAADFQRLGAPGTPLMLVRGQPQLGFAPERIERRLAGG